MMRRRALVALAAWIVPLVLLLLPRRGGWVNGLLITRRRAIETTAASAAAVVTTSSSATSWPSPAWAAPASRSSKSVVTTASPNAPLSNQAQIPRVGYSLYKTSTQQVGTGVALALAAGVRHFDCATQYGTNAQVGQVLQQYIQNGKDGLWQTTENNNLFDGVQIVAPIPRTAAKRRQELFVTHKISNAEQSLSTDDLQKSILAQRDMLLPLGGRGGGGGHPGPTTNNNFMAMLHSPLTDKDRRLKSYAALVDLQQRREVAAVGVCHYGVSQLQELVQAGLPPPQVIQLVLSPFHPHQDVAAWATAHGSVLSCAAWSKLSSTQGPQEGWAKLGQLAARRGYTKQQVLIRWAVQKGYLCVPRSGAQYKVERAAIVENAWPSIRDFVLTPDEMDFLDSLDEQLPAGQLGVLDGWEASDIVNEKWDPTLLSA